MQDRPTHRPSSGNHRHDQRGLPGQYSAHPPSAPVAENGDVRVHPLWHEHDDGPRVGRGPRGSGPVQPGQRRRRSVDARTRQRRDERRHPHVQAPRRILPVAVGLHEALGGILAVEGRARRPRARGLRGCRSPRPEVRRVPVPLGHDRAYLRSGRGLQRLLHQPAHRAAHPLRPGVLRVAGRRVRRGAQRQGPGLRLAAHLRNGSRTGPRGRHLGVRPGCSLVRQRGWVRSCQRVVGRSRFSARGRTHRREVTESRRRRVFAPGGFRRRGPGIARGTGRLLRSPRLVPRRGQHLDPQGLVPPRRRGFAGAQRRRALLDLEGIGWRQRHLPPERSPEPRRAPRRRRRGGARAPRREDR